MKTLLIQIAMLISIQCCAQLQPARQFLNNQCKVVSDSSTASYFRIVENAGNRFVVKDYYISGELEMVAPCSRVTPAIVMDGTVTWYYRNGKIKEQTAYAISRQRGLGKTYYENGDLKSEILYQENKTTYLKFLAESGKSLLINGTGTIEYDDSETKMHIHREIKDSLEIESYSINTITSDTLYTFLEKRPEYVGGIEKMMKDIRINMTYPKSARRRGIEGIVYVRFIVDKEGKVQKPEILSGIQDECDAVALNAVSRLGQWEPGLAHQKPVDVNFVLPLKFRLN
jgi:TonB family protein